MTTTNDLELVPPVRRVLTSRLVTFTAVTTEADAQFVYSLYADDRCGMPLRYGGLPPAFDAFVADVVASAFDHVIIRISLGAQPAVGYVRLDDVDLVAGHGVFTLVFAPDYQRRSLAIAAGARYLQRAFTMWPLRKLYFHMPMFNLAKFPAMSFGPVDHEGTLRDFLYFDCRYWDMLIFSMTRDGWFSHLRASGVTSDGEPA